jgi:hypothetical protein
MTTQDKKYTLSKETLMPLGMVIALCGGVVWISTQLTSINYKLDILEEKMDDNWTRRDMENWGLKLKMENPELAIPKLQN